jgi:hypothetical protein
MALHGQDSREALLIDLIGAAVSEEAVAACDAPLDQFDEACALATRGSEPSSVLAVSQHENIRRNIQTYLQPTLGRDNDRYGAYSATVNALQNQFVKLAVPHARRPP